LESRNLELAAVTNTHSHSDHTCGNRELLKRTSAEFLSSDDIAKRETLRLEDEEMEVIHTPGHTRDSVCLAGSGFLLSGDTLFNGKVGRCFTGDVKAFFRSIRRLMELPDSTVVYGGHDYVREYMEFAAKVEPDNRDIERYLQKYDPGLVCATMSEEKKVDPFLRLDEPSVMEFLRKRKLPRETPLQRFSSLLSF
ncbi:MAG: MBL fold metallo-hydrolase, partial [Candidatus Aegiribacteria sp.]|nr:MBL fold metallo-hydrolase [Candidatus Aegiribacteria sp.]